MPPTFAANGWYEIRIGGEVMYAGEASITYSHKETQDMGHCNNVTETGAKALIEAGAFSTDIEKRTANLHDKEAGDEVLLASISSSGGFQVEDDATKKARLAMERPDRARGSHTLARVADLVEFVKRFRQPGTVVFGARPGATGLGSAPAGFTAIADFSEKFDELSWNRFRAFVGLSISREAKIFNDVTYDQSDFAKLVEKWADKILPHEDATAANLLVMASDLQVEERQVSKVQRDPRSRTVNLQYGENTEAKTRLFPRMKLSLPVISGRPEREVEVWVSLVKQGQGVYGFSLEIPQLDKLIETEFDLMSAEVSAEAGVPVWQGVPPGEMPVG